MKAKTVTINLFPDGTSDVDLEGVAGVGCSAVADASSAVQSAEKSLASLIGQLSSGAISVASRIGLSSRVPVDTTPEPSASSVIPISEEGKVTAEHGGLVVLPLQGSSTDEAKLQQSIENSFSDTVVVKPNPDGTSGVFQPVFRSTAGHDFMYVLVPVKATSSAAAQESTSQSASGSSAASAN